MTTTRWMLAALGGGLVIVLCVYYLGPPGDKLSTALRATARWSLLWFTLATTGSALTTLFGSRFERLAQRGRDFGLSFAAAHLNHVALVAWYLVASREPHAFEPLMFFAVGLVWVYLLALLSLSGSLRSMLSARWWRIIRTVGVEYIAFVFLSELASRAFGKGPANLLVYLPFLAVSVCGPLLRIAALIKRWRLAMEAEETLKPRHAA
ncbi:MAG TPA: hypothetical protein VHV81_03040 [Steroidobacteraceae bacterium]|jgi:hypothetical protein|nr:hypothetical protein [Steroidobacteraceae bacterium]